jgi:hypothetical protein
MRLLDHEPTIVTVGAELFAAALGEQAARYTTVTWQPPPEAAA